MNHSQNSSGTKRSHTRLICLHGSPGAPNDFRWLREELLLLNQNLELLAQPREGYPGFLPGQLALKAGDVVLGYSWGAAVALNELIKTVRSDSMEKKNASQVHKLILIAPYLFPKKKSSGLGRALLSLPVFSTLLLGVLRKKVESKLIQETSHPFAPSADYVTDIHAATTPAHLSRAALEKSEFDLTELLQAPELKRVRMLIIAGQNDQTSPRHEQLDPLCRHLNSNSVSYQVTQLENAGHNLLWSHPQILSQLIENFISQEPS